MTARATAIAQNRTAKATTPRRILMIPIQNHTVRVTNQIAKVAAELHIRIQILTVTVMTLNRTVIAQIVTVIVTAIAKATNQNHPALIQRATATAMIRNQKAITLTLIVTVMIQKVLVITHTAAAIAMILNLSVMIPIVTAAATNHTLKAFIQGAMNRKVAV